MFPEIKAALAEVELSGVYVLPWLQTVSDQALRQPMLRAIELAGRKPWTTLRAGRANELRDEFLTRLS